MEAQPANNIQIAHEVPSPIPFLSHLTLPFSLLIFKFSYNRGADPRASQKTQGASTLRLREAQSGPVPCSGARRQNKVLDEVSAAILGGEAAENK
jgi:hypothetical protein